MSVSRSPNIQLFQGYNCSFPCLISSLTDCGEVILVVQFNITRQTVITLHRLQTEGMVPFQFLGVEIQKEQDCSGLPLTRWPRELIIWRDQSSVRLTALLPKRHTGLLIEKRCKGSFFTLKSRRGLKRTSNSGTKSSG